MPALAGGVVGARTAYATTPSTSHPPLLEKEGSAAGLVTLLVALRSFWIAIIGTVGLFTTVPPSHAASPLKIHYDISVKIDPATRQLEGSSVITADKDGDYRLLLNGRFKVKRILLNGKPLTGRWTSSTGLQGWRIPETAGGTRRISVEWSGKLAPLDTTLDHRRVLSAAEPVTGEEGTFLPDASAWYPRIAGVLASYELSLELPVGQRGLVPGRMVEEYHSAHGYRARFDFRFPAEGIVLIAGPYRIDEIFVRHLGGKRIRVRTYFHPQIAELAPSYLEAVKGYLELYEHWIGDYPFNEFSVVSSPTPTGFGMPTLTYLGINVLRLPFIRSTSLGHEVLHNWWGNGVYPDYSSGNWSEGLTTFMADYAYKERESAEAARQMRLGWLRDFAAVPRGRDEPLVRFTSRTHGTEQIVGYDKAAMVFFMLRDLIGREAFDRGIRRFWEKEQFRIASWDDLRHAFEYASGRDLKPFFDQWLERSGAPIVRIVSAKSERSGDGYQLTVFLSQHSPAYSLHLPLAVHTDKGVETRVVDLDLAQQAFPLHVSGRPREVALDPQLHVFRRLARNEAPPILRQIMIDPSTVTVVLPKEGEARHAAEVLAERMQDHPLRPFPPTRFLRRAPALIIGLERDVDVWLKAQSLPDRPERVEGKGTAQAWTVSREHGAPIAIVSAKDAAALAALARPLPHYGRQSYVIFEGPKAIDRGAWPARVQVVPVTTQK